MDVLIYTPESVVKSSEARSRLPEHIRAVPEMKNMKKPYETGIKAIADEMKPIFQFLDPKIQDITQIATERDPYGYNEHTSVHVGQVYKYANDLLALSLRGNPYELSRYTSDPTLPIGAFMQLGHDLGMAIDIKDHPYISPDILEVICPALTKDPLNWNMIKMGIEMHDSSSSRDGLHVHHVLNHWLNGETPLLGITPEQKEIIDNPIFMSAFAAFFFADKVDIGIARVPQGKITVENRDQALEDPHIFINTYGITNNITYPDNDDNKLQWNIVLNPYLDSSEKKHYNPLLNNIDPVTTSDWLSKFNDNYMSRSIKAACAAFALFPNVNEFVINVENTNSEAPQEIKITREEAKKFIKTQAR